jgi:hypothetical protein
MVPLVGFFYIEHFSRQFCLLAKLYLPVITKRESSEGGDSCYATSQG